MSALSEGLQDGKQYCSKEMLRKKELNIKENCTFSIFSFTFNLLYIFSCVLAKE